MIRLLLSSYLLICSIFIQAQVKIEYIAHASFIIESPSGVRVAIDPYNGKHSLGYYYPDNLKANAVAITHPHFDHDAAYYFQSAPVISEAGEYAFGDVSITGFAAEHAGAERFMKRGAIPHNTIWRLETSGLSVLHLGDNGLLSDGTLAEIGEVDVLMIQVFENHHFYTNEEFERVIDKLKPGLIIPMHYRLTEISNIPTWTGLVDPWIEQQNGSNHDSNTLTINKSDLQGNPKIIKLRHSPLVKPWSSKMKNSWSKFSNIRSTLSKEEKDLKSLNEQMTEVIEASPEALIYYNLKAQILDSLGRGDRVIHLLEEGLVNSGLDDLEQQVIARTRLARLYRKRGLEKLAEEQYRWVASQKRTFQQVFLDEARSFLK